MVPLASRPWLPAALLAGYATLALLPVLVAALQGLEPRPLRDELATGLGLAGFAMLLVAFLLSGRYRGLSAGVGMDRIMQFHQVSAYLLLAFLLVHPFLYSLPMDVPSPLDPDRSAGLHLPFAPGLTGLLAWTLLGVVVFAAVARDDLPGGYEAWRISHGAGAVVIALLALHHALAAGRYSADPWLAGLWVAAVAVALLSLIHVHLFIPLRQRRFPLRVSAVRREAERTWTIELEPDAGHPGTPLPFRAGQFAWLKFERTLLRIREHPFSISSAPAQWPRLAFTIKEAGDFTGGIGRLAPGTRAYADGGYGHFTLDPNDTRPLVLIAGGVGMAPIMALLRELRATRSRRAITLLQGNRTRGQRLFTAELDDLRTSLDLTVHEVLGEPDRDWHGHTGIPDRALLETILPAGQRRESVYYVCGPPALIDAMESTLLRDFRVPPRQVRSERFRYTLGARHGSARRLLLATLATAGVILAGLLAFALR